MSSVDATPTDRAAAPVTRLVARWLDKYGERISGHLQRPAQPARWREFPPDLAPALGTALAARGIERLYSHQREAWDHVTAGEHVVVVTPTASGKTLCYNLPVLAAVHAQRAKALYLFPTKALAQDQVAELLELNTAGAPGLRACT
ncbi:MAG: DEAD/DEAH box helicase, partial [Dokdonella sp.]|nr:DEAD/DEAH box helicase [Dokdonella sp.]